MVKNIDLNFKIQRVKIKNSENDIYEFEIQDICESYICHHVFMNRYTYEKNIEEFYINASYLKEKELSKDLKIY